MKLNYFEEDIIKSSPIPYIFGELKKSTNGSSSFILKEVNDIASKVFNIDDKNFVNKSLNEVFMIGNEKRILEDIENEEKSRLHIKECNFDYELISKKIYDSNYIIWFMDITKEVDYEESNKIRAEFFTNLSHELRTPLNLIFSSLQILDLKIKNTNISDAQSIEKYLNMANQNTYRLLKLVNNIIDSNKITSGYFDYNPQNYDIVNFVEGICQSVVDFAKQKNIEIIFDTEIEESLISFDLDKMERIILNILSNAIKFSNAEGQINIGMKEIDDMIEIQISDDGIGIPKHKLASIFDKFKQVDNNIIRRGEGSGIGLYLVKSLVDMHGGDIQVDSQLDKGTIFTIKIPNVINHECECTIVEKNFQNSYIEKIKVEFSDIYA